MTSLLTGELRNILSFIYYAAGSGLVELHYHLDNGRFTAAGLTDDCKGLTFVKIEGHIVAGGKNFTVVHFKLFDQMVYTENNFLFSCCPFMVFVIVFIIRS